MVNELAWNGTSRVPYKDHQTRVSHFSALKTAFQREEIQKISENAIAGWLIVLEEFGVMESIPTYASR